jgi:hypothetical protein
MTHLNKSIRFDRMRRQTLHIKWITGKRRASVYDIQSFRSTWITLALASSVPLESVQRATDHRTVEVVMKSYFKPGREDFRQALLKKMPQAMSKTACDSV